MCEPATPSAISIGLTAASGVAGYIGQQNAASAQESANNQSRNLAIQNQQLQIRALQNQQDEENRRADEALRSNAKQAAAAKATAAVAAGEAGISGLSVDALLGDLTRQETANKNDIIATQDFGQRQRELDREGVGITATSQVNQLPLVEYPSFFEFALGTGAAGFDVYDSRTPRQTKPPKE